MTAANEGTCEENRPDNQRCSGLFTLRLVTAAGLGTALLAFAPRRRTAAAA
jgi:hypothetical protein